MTLDDLEMSQVRIFGAFRVTLQIWEATTATLMKILSATELLSTTVGLLFSDV